MDIRLPSDEVTTVELVYEKLKKHCFLCYSLFHEKKNCPLRKETSPGAHSRPIGINQQLTLDRLEAEKRRFGQRKEGKEDSRDLSSRNGSYASKPGRERIKSRRSPSRRSPSRRSTSRRSPDLRSPSRKRSPHVRSPRNLSPENRVPPRISPIRRNRRMSSDINGRRNHSDRIVSSRVRDQEMGYHFLSWSGRDLP